MPEDIQTIISRVTEGSHIEADIQALVSLLQSGQVSLATGDGAVALGGSANDAVIVTGDNNQISILKGADAEVIKGILRETFLSFQAPPQPTGIPSNLPRSGMVKFVGRDRDLQTLHRQLQQRDRATIAAIVGMGGVGKTELALQYALTYQQDYPGGFCWLQVRGVDLGTQIVSYTKVHLKLTPPDDLDLPGQVSFCWQQWLAGNVLIVLDDVLDYQTIKPYLPPPNPRFKVLFTSRVRPGKSIHQLLLDVLDETSAIGLLVALVGEDRVAEELNEAKELCDWLGYLPLGIEIVGRYLDQKPDLSLEKTLQRLKSKRLESQALCNTDDDMTASLGVAAAFELSWDTLSPKAKELGCLLGLFAAAPIPWSLVEACQPNADSEDLEDLRDEKLLKLNLLQRIEQSIYRLHPLMREFFQMKLSQCDSEKILKDQFCQVMVAIAQSIPIFLTQKDVLKLISTIPHIAEAITNHLEFVSDADVKTPFEGLGKFYESQGFYDQAKSWYQKCYTTVEARFGVNHINCADSLSQLARIHRLQGQYKEAEPLYVSALNMQKQLLQDEHSSIATTLDELALLYDAQGHNAKAEPFYNQALQMRQRLFEDKHPDVAESLSHLALFYDDQGHHAKAEPLFIQALEMRKKLLGAEHPRVATSLNDLAYCYSSQERYAEAEVLYLESLNLSKRLLGDEHPEIAMTLNNLAHLYILQERYAEAQPLFIQAIELNQKLLGSAHPEIATNMDNLASLYDLQGCSSKAETLYHEALTMRKKLLGDTHPYVAVSLNNLAKLYYLQHQYGEAEPLYRQAIDILSTELGSDHPMTIRALSNLQELLSVQTAELNQ